MDFTEDNIRLLFGNEAAEDETVEDLKKFYIKGSAYEKLKSDIKLYVLVGHKGTGKSALLSVMKSEDESAGNISLIIRPEDIEGLSYEKTNYIDLVNTWKRGLSEIIVKKLIDSIKDLRNKKPQDSWIDKLYKAIIDIVNTGVDITTKNLKILPEDQLKILQNSSFNDRKITVYIDDLDKGWENNAGGIDNIAAMFDAIRSFVRDYPNIKLRVALRADVYSSVRTTKESTDKIDSSVIWLSWTNHEVFCMLIRRIQSFFKLPIYEDDKMFGMPQRDLMPILSNVFVEVFEGTGKWANKPMYNVLMSLVRKRPRDLIKICILAARKAKDNNHSRINTEDLRAVFSEYSQGRLQDTINEYKTQLPNIERILLEMKPNKKELDNVNPCCYSKDELLLKIKYILEHVGRCRFTGSNADVTSMSLAAFLYKINFLTARKTTSLEFVTRFYFEESKYLCSENYVDFGFEFEIHPAYRWALQPAKIDEIYRKLTLSN